MARPPRPPRGQEGTNCVFPLLSITPFPFSYRGSGTGAKRPSRHPSVEILRMKDGGRAREPRTAGFAFVCGLGWCILPIENAARQREGAGARALSPPGWQRPSRKSEQSGRPPFRYGNHSPLYCNNRWVASAKRNPAFTRAARPEGERVIRKRERTLVLSLLCAVRPRRPRPCPLGAGSSATPFKATLRRASQMQSLTMTSPSAPDGAATSPQRGGKVGGADGVGGRAQARDPSLRSG